MIRLVRLALYPIAVYLFFRVGFPEGEGTLYHMVSLPFLLAGASATFFLIKVVDVSSRLGQWGIELGFLVLTLLYVGFTMPQTDNIPPLSKLIEGRTPTQSTARLGVEKLGLDAGSAPAKLVIGLFPKG